MMLPHWKFKILSETKNPCQAEFIFLLSLFPLWKKKKKIIITILSSLYENYLKIIEHNV